MFVLLRRGSFYDHTELFLRFIFLWSNIQKQSWPFFLERKFFLGMFLRTRGMHFYQRCQKTLDKNSKAFRSISEINYINNQFSQKKHFMRKRLQSHRLHVWQSCRKKLPQKSEKFPARKKCGRKMVYWGIFFLKRFPWARRKQKRHSC